jgi:hypothetical protein
MGLDAFKNYGKTSFSELSSIAILHPIADSFYGFKIRNTYCIHLVNKTFGFHILIF